MERNQIITIICLLVAAVVIIGLLVWWWCMPSTYPRYDFSQLMPLKEALDEKACMVRLYLIEVLSGVGSAQHLTDYLEQKWTLAYLPYFNGDREKTKVVVDLWLERLKSLSSFHNGLYPTIETLEQESEDKAKELAKELMLGVDNSRLQEQVEHKIVRCSVLALKQYEDLKYRNYNESLASFDSYKVTVRELFNLLAQVKIMSTE